MEDMRSLHDMGAISEDFMEALEDENWQANTEVLQQQFLERKSGIVKENQRHGLKSNCQQQPLAKNTKKRMRKLQKKARKAQRA